MHGASAITSGDTNDIRVYELGSFQFSLDLAITRFDPNFLPILELFLRRGDAVDQDSANRGVCVLDDFIHTSKLGVTKKGNHYHLVGKSSQTAYAIILTMVFRLETPRLILRPFAEKDIEAFAAYRSDPLVAIYQGWEVPYSLEQAARFVSEMQAATPGHPGEWYQLAMEIKATGEMIGDCAFQVLRWDERQAEVGITLASAYQGRGYASEGMGCLLDYLFGELHLHRVRANTDPQNTASAQLLKRLGFRHEGRWLQSLWFKGAWADENWYAILSHEWLATNLSAN